MSPRKNLASLILSLVAASAFAGTTPDKSPGGSLYARLGGATKVSAIVDQAVMRVASRIGAASLEQIKTALGARICALAGGGCRMDAPPLDVSDAGFVALVAELRSAMRAEHVPLAARNELLELLAPQPRDVASL